MSEPVSLEQLIAQFVDGLFVNGSGQKADRLVLTVDGPPSRDLGGWCKQAIADRLMVALVSLPNGTVVTKREAGSCRTCGGSGFIAQKQCMDDGYGEVDSCPDCGIEAGGPVPGVDTQEPT